MTQVRESFNPVLMAVNATRQYAGAYLGGFLAKTSGTITVTSKDGNGLSDVILVDAVPVTAGIYTPIPLTIPTPGYTVTLAGGASGTLMA